MRIGTIYQKEVTDGYVKDVTCPHCNAIINADLKRSVQTGTIFLIPFIKKTVLYYSVCPNCDMRYILNRKNYNDIIKLPSKEENWSRVCGLYLQNKKLQSENDILRSDKNIFIAAILSLIFGIFGLQNLYMGHMKRFSINISFFALSLIIFGVIFATDMAMLSFVSALLLAINVYWGLVDFVRILSGHAKDVNRKYILTNNQYRKRLSVYSRLHNN